jgi:hypothetical protein
MGICRRTSSGSGLTVSETFNDRRIPGGKVASTGQTRIDTAISSLTAIRGSLRGPRNAGDAGGAVEVLFAAQRPDDAAL